MTAYYISLSVSTFFMNKLVVKTGVFFVVLQFYFPDL